MARTYKPRPKVEKQCPQCGRDMIGTPRKLYCSDVCRVLAHRRGTTVTPQKPVTEKRPGRTVSAMEQRRRLSEALVTMSGTAMALDKFLNLEQAMATATEEEKALWVNWADEAIKTLRRIKKLGEK